MNRPLQIMLVDDDKSWRRVGPELFEDAFLDADIRAKVRPFASPRVAAQALREQHWDAVITDMFFPPPGRPDAPREDYQEIGLNLIPRARKAGVGVVIAYTEHQVKAPQVRVRAADLGADAFCSRADFTAPVGSHNLEEVVDLISSASRVGDPVAPSAENPRDVAVVYGANTEAQKGVFAFLSALDLNPIEFEEAVGWTGKMSPPIPEILDVLFKRAQAVVVLLTGDEQVSLRPGLAELRGSDDAGLQARPNVYFEAGMALAVKPRRTVIVRLGPTRPASDITGLHTLLLDDEPHTRERFARRLELAGCPVKRTERMRDTPPSFLETVHERGSEGEDPQKGRET